MEAPTKKLDCRSDRSVSFISFITTTLDLLLLSNPAHTVWAIATAVSSSGKTIPSLASAATNPASGGSADAGAAESSAAADSRTAQTVDHLCGPTFISVMALPLCGRLESKKDYVMLAEIEAFFFPASGYGSGRSPDVSADAVDRTGNLGLEVGRQRNVSERGKALLPFGDGRLHECLHGLADIGIGVFGADNFVAGQQDRVGARRGRGVDLREVEHQVVALAFDGDVRDGLADPVVADVDDSARSLDSRHIEVLLHGVRPLVVGNSPLGLLDGLRGALVALRRGSHASVECFAGTLGPGAARGGLEVLLEVVAGSG